MTSISKNIPLSDYSSYKIGGSADFFAEVKNSIELIEILKKWKKISENFEDNKKEILILGGGTNLLVDDKGYGGLVILNKINFIKEDQNNIQVGSGTTIEELLTYCINKNLSGLEWAGGLPGTVGGAIRGNAGAFGGEIKDSIKEVESYLSTYEVNDSPTSQVGDGIRRRKSKDCNFGYRDSIFKSGSGKEDVIIFAIFKLKKGNQESIRRKIEEKINYRKKRHPLEYPNIGSIFKNIPIEKVPRKTANEFKDKIKKDPFPILPVVKLIAGAGMTGKRVGDIVVSEKHPNYLVNLGNGKSVDVIRLIGKVKDAVRKKYNARIEEEITII